MVVMELNLRAVTGNCVMKSKLIDHIDKLATESAEGRHRASIDYHYAVERLRSRHSIREYRSSFSSNEIG